MNGLLVVDRDGVVMGVCCYRFTVCYEEVAGYDGISFTPATSSLIWLDAFGTIVFSGHLHLPTILFSEYPLAHKYSSDHLNS
jgi:hypothetical protein